MYFKVSFTFQRIFRVNKKLHVLSRSSYLWKHLDFRNYEVEPKDLRHFSKQKLVGRQTCSVKIECRYLFVMTELPQS